MADDVMQRAHVHLPITDVQGNLLVYADVSLLAPGTTTVLTPVAYDGPGETAQPVQWPVTFAPANVDLWLETPGRFDLHVDGPNGFSGVIQGVDLGPAPANQVQQPVGTQVTSQPGPARWLQGEDGYTARFKDSGLVGAHDHDGTAAQSTTLGNATKSLDSDATATRLGYGATAGTGGTVLGYAAQGGPLNGAVLGSSSGAGSGGTSIGDQHPLTPAANTTFLSQDPTGAETAYQVGTDLVVRNLLARPAADQIGQAALPATPAGVSHPVWVAGHALTQRLVAPHKALVGAVGGTLGFYGSDGTTVITRPAGATGALASLLDALGAYGLLG